MSGRDLHTFSTQCRAEDAGKSADIWSETLLTSDIVAHWSVDLTLVLVLNSSCTNFAFDSFARGTVALLVFIYLPPWIRLSVPTVPLTYDIPYGLVSELPIWSISAQLVLSLPIFFAKVSINTFRLQNWWDFQQFQCHIISFHPRRETDTSDEKWSGQLKVQTGWVWKTTSHHWC